MILAHVQQRDDGRYAIQAPYNEKLIDCLRQYPGFVFERAPVKQWLAYPDAIALLLKDEGVKKIAKVKVVGARPQPVQALSFSTHPIDDDQRFREYQKLGVKFLINTSAGGCLLADDLGLGKTRTTIGALQYLPKPAVVACPAYLKHVWLGEAAKLDIPILSLDGTKAFEDVELQTEDGIVVTTYNALPFWMSAFVNVKTFVMDEAHMLVGAQSKRGVACKDLSKQAEHVIGLTATPIPNQIHTLWNVIDTISPGRFGHFIGFGKRYCDGHQEEIKVKEEMRKIWNWKGKSHLDELNFRMKHFMLRRLKKDVNLELPAKIRTNVEVEVDTKSFADLWTIDNKSKTQLEINKAAKQKIPHVVSMAVDRVTAGSSVIVFTYQKAIAREIVARLKKAGVATFLATGDQTIKQRKKAAEAAKEHGNSVIVATMDSMGAGVDLSFADVVIFAELHYVPAVLLQAEGRSHRFGQKRLVNIYYMIAIGSIDEIVRNVILNKLEAHEETLGDLGDDIHHDLKGKDEEDSLEEMRQMLLKMGEDRRLKGAHAGKKTRSNGGERQLRFGFDWGGL